MNGQKHIYLELSKDQSLVLKCVAICAMLCHHVFCFPPSIVDSHFSWLTLQIGEIGKVCVSIFLFVSGYGLYKQYNSLISKVLPPPIISAQHSDSQIVRRKNEKLGRFVIWLKETIKFELKRFIKFYTNYWVIFLIFVPVSVYVFNIPLSKAYGEESDILTSLIIDILGFNGFESYNITWWYNKVILTFYLIFPLLYYAVKKCGWLVLLVAMVWMKYNHIQCLWYWHDWLFSFILGMCSIRYKEQIESLLNKIGRNWSIVVAVLFTVFWIAERQYAIIPYSGPFITGTRSDGFITFGIFMIVCLCPIPKNANKIMCFIGFHSANIYLIHTFIYSRWFASYIYATEYAVVSFLTLLFVCLGLSWCIELIKEKCAINKLSQYCISSINKL
ncbi:MAG: acyltransferase family protein [Paludibacteraceae bacterium]|nr:acyltransferase family protein [Paludibacteraceae bacterium]